MWGLTRLAIYLFRFSWAWINAIRSGNWPTAEAIVTADPATTYAGLAGFTVEVPYTYRFQGELYTGLHEEPSFGGVGHRFMKRFAKGGHFLVRVNPSEPEASIMRDRDQTDDIQHRLATSDELRNQEVVHKRT
jgi:hypothetical protein